MLLRESCAGPRRRGGLVGISEMRAEISCVGECRRNPEQSCTGSAGVLEVSRRCRWRRSSSNRIVGKSVAILGEGPAPASPDVCRVALWLRRIGQVVCAGVGVVRV